MKAIISVSKSKLSKNFMCDVILASRMKRDRITRERVTDYDVMLTVCLVEIVKKFVVLIFLQGYVTVPRLVLFALVKAKFLIRQ